MRASWPTGYAPGCCDRSTTGKTDYGRCELGRSYQTISKDLTRVMNRLKRGIAVGALLVPAPRFMLRARGEWLSKIAQAGVPRRAELLYQQLDGLQALRRNLRPEFLAESRKHKAAKLLRQIPCIGPIRAARLLALMQTPHRFRSKRQLWTYSGLGIETHDSAQFRFVSGQLQRSKKPQQIRGLSRNHNHERKEIFKSTATRASCGKGPFHDLYAGLLAQGMKPEMARLTLARKIAAITLTLWKKEERFRRNSLPCNDFQDQID
jgi:transposase